MSRPAGVDRQTTAPPGPAPCFRARLATLDNAVRPPTSGTTYINFMDLDGATPQRVRAAYSPLDWAWLVELKYRRDPHYLFRFNRNIPPSGAFR